MNVFSLRYYVCFSTCPRRKRNDSDYSCGTVTFEPVFAVMQEPFKY